MISISIIEGIFLLMILALSLTPLLSGFAAYKIGQVYLADTTRPRNRILRRLFTSSALITLSALHISFLSAFAIANFFMSGTLNVDPTSITLTISLLALFIQPWLHWRALVALDGGIEILKKIPETQNQMEDRRFGDARRDLESVHIKAQKHLDEAEAEANGVDKE